MKESQYRVLSVINDLKNESGKFPTYKEIGEKLGLTRQRIEQRLSKIIKEITAFKSKEEQFADHLKLTKNGWVSYMVYIKDGLIIDEKVASGKFVPKG